MIYTVRIEQSWGGGHGEGPEEHHVTMIGYFLEETDAIEWIKRNRKDYYYGTFAVQRFELMGKEMGSPPQNVAIQG